MVGELESWQNPHVLEQESLKKSWFGPLHPPYRAGLSHIGKGNSHFDIPDLQKSMQRFSRVKECNLILIEYLLHT